MSLLKARHRLVKFLHDKIGGGRTFHGSALRGDNLVTVLSAQQLWVAVLSDVLDLVCSGEKPFRLLVKCVNRIDVFDWLKSLDDLDAFLLSKESGYTSVREWETLSGAEGDKQVFIHLVNTLTISKWTAWRRERDAASFAALHQCFSFCKRISIDHPMLEEAACKNWMSQDERFGATYPPRIHGWKVLREIISEWFPKAKWSEVKPRFVPRHGPGAVIEGYRTKDEKFLGLAFSTDEHQLISKLDLWEELGAGLAQQPYLYDDPIETTRHCAVVFVRKSWKTFRTISMEPCTTMWLQQGLGASLEYAIHRCDCSQYYDITSEGVNRWLCEEGSIDGSYSTWDLSSASDRIRWALVQYLFEYTWLAPLLPVLRTEYVSIESPWCSGIYRQGKYAPMGNRQCFPIMSIILSAVCEASIRTHYHVDKASIVLRDRMPKACVYGDDIVCESSLDPYITDWLERLGLLVNRDKSFFDAEAPFFRESCGAEYLNGLDVAPVRLGRRFCGFQADPVRCVEGLVDLANQLYRKNLLTARCMIVSHILSNEIPILFDRDGRRGIQSDNPTNSHLQTVWHPDYQHFYWKCWCVTEVNSGIDWSDPLGSEPRTPLGCQIFYDYQEGCAPGAHTQSAKLFEWLRTHRFREGWESRAERPLSAYQLERKAALRLVPAEGLPVSMCGRE